MVTSILPSLCCSKNNKKIDEIITYFTQILSEIKFTCYETIGNGYKISILNFPYISCEDNSGNHLFDKDDKKIFSEINVKLELFSKDNETNNLFIQKIDPIL